MYITQLKDTMLKDVVGGSANVTFTYNSAGQPDHIMVDLVKGNAVALLVNRDIGASNKAIDLPGGGYVIGGSVSAIGMTL